MSEATLHVHVRVDQTSQEPDAEQKADVPVETSEVCKECQQSEDFFKLSQVLYINLQLCLQINIISTYVTMKLSIFTFLLKCFGKQQECQQKETVHYKLFQFHLCICLLMLLIITTLIF